MPASAALAFIVDIYGNFSLFHNIYKLVLIKTAFTPKFFSRIKLKTDAPSSSQALCNYNGVDDDSKYRECLYVPGTFLSTLHL